VVYEHFIPHNSKKYEIIESLNKKTKTLIWSMLTVFSDSFLDHMEPINLVADYFGEKYALYLTFMYHHLGWLIIPGVAGTVLSLFQVYLGFKRQEDD
jgi:hypothetical protein